MSRVGCRYGGLWTAFAPPSCSALASPRLTPRCSAPRLRLASRPPLRQHRRLSCCHAAPRSPYLAWRHAAQPYRPRLARRPPLRRLSLRHARLASLGAALLSTIAFALHVGSALAAAAVFAPPRYSALASHRLTPRYSAPLPSPRTSAAASAASYGGFGGLRTAALRRARLALLGAALLSPVAFASRVGRRLGGSGRFHCAALALPRLAPRCSAPLPSPCTSASA